LGALLIVDTVASLAAVPIDVDTQRIDICFADRKRPSPLPRGMSPIQCPAGQERVSQAQDDVQSWYFDLTTAMNYWGKPAVSSHAADFLDFRAAGKRAPLWWRGPGGALGAASWESARRLIAGLERGT